MSPRRSLVAVAFTAAAAVAGALASIAFCATAIAAPAPAETPTAYAIVAQDQVALRATARDGSPQQALLWQGDLLEVRGERLDHLQVYDHRRERAGYVRAMQVRRLTLTPGEAPQLLAVLRFLRDTPGAEALGIAYAAAYLKAVPAGEITAEPFDALGTLAERLARRASVRQAKPQDAALAAHLEVAAAYGVQMRSIEHHGRVQLCYQGDAFLRTLALEPTPEQHARAALALTRDDCIEPAMPPLARAQLDEERAQLLEQVDTASLPEALKNRLRLRRAGAWAALAYQRSRQPEGDAAAAAERALQALAGVNKTELADDDQMAYAEAAVRTNASRWALQPHPAGRQRLALLTEAGLPGQTCLLLIDRERAHPKPLAERCTYGTVWAQSASANAAGTALAVAVQPLASWRELWVFHASPKGWKVNVLPPATGDTQLGVVEFAGWLPDGKRLLAAREAKVDGRFKRSFEVLRVDSLVTEKRADKPESITAFYRWQDAAWKRQSPILR
ncbi:MAG: hypothetical protein AB1430_07940 [Pseudomonadota bacterium]